MGPIIFGLPSFLTIWCMLSIRRSIRTIPGAYIRHWKWLRRSLPKDIKSWMSSWGRCL